MATRKNEIEILLKARDEASKVIASFNASLGDLVKAGSAAAVGFAAVDAAADSVRNLTVFLKDSVRAALEAQDAQNRLGSAVELSGRSWSAVSGSVNKYLQEIQRTTRFSDEQAAEALQRLITFTGDYESALRALPVTLDLAARLHLDLETASKAVGVAIEGNATALARYGIRLDDATKEALKTANASERVELVIKALGERMAGSAAADAKTLSGQLAILSNLSGEVKEQVGAFFVEVGDKSGVVKDLAGLAGDVAKALEDFRKSAAGKFVIDVAVLGIEDVRATVKLIDLIVQALPEVAAEAARLAGAGEGTAQVIKAMLSPAPVDTFKQEMLDLSDVIENEITKAAEKAGKALDNLSKKPLTFFQQMQQQAAAAAEALQNELAKRLSNANALLPAPFSPQQLVPIVEQLAKLGVDAREAFFTAFSQGEAPADIFAGLKEQLDGVKDAVDFLPPDFAEQLKALDDMVAGLAEASDFTLKLGEDTAAVLGPLNENYASMDAAISAIAEAQELAARTGIEWTDAMSDAATQALTTAAANQLLSQAIFNAAQAAGNAVASHKSAAAAVKAAVLDAIADILRGLAKSELVKALAALAEYNYGGAALHFAAAAAAAAAAGYVHGLAARQEDKGTGKAARGGIVAGTDIGDVHPFLLEAGEAVIPRSLTKLILGGQAAIVATKSLEAIGRAGAGFRPSAAREMRLHDSIASGARAVGVRATTAAAGSVTRNLNLSNTFNAVRADIDTEQLVEDITELVERRGYRLVASRFAGTP